MKWSWNSCGCLALPVSKVIHLHNLKSFSDLKFPTQKKIPHPLGYWKTLPKWISLKLPMGLASLLGMVLYIAYTTAIISILSTPVVLVRSVDDLISHGFTFSAHEQSEAGKSKLKVTSSRSTVLFLFPPDKPCWRGFPS